MLLSACLCMLVLLQPAGAQDLLQQQRYGENYRETIKKLDGDATALLKAAVAYQNRYQLPVQLRAQLNVSDASYVARAEAEPNNFFDTADNINDVLAMSSLRHPDAGNGMLIEAATASGDVDVFAFTVDTTKMYYFASTHSNLADGSDDLDVRMRLFHESDTDTTFVTGFGGVEGVDKMRGDIIGSPTDGRNGSGDFRLTGWTPPVDPATGAKIGGTYYLWIYNGDHQNGSLAVNGTYYLTTYNVPLETFVSKFEPNQTASDVLNNGLVSTLPTDAVVRSFMAYNPDTLKFQEDPIELQGNNAYPTLMARGDEDVDHYLFNYKAGHSVEIETMPYWGWYRDADGTIGPGGSRLTDTRIRVYDGDYTSILFEDDDGAREQMDGPNNIHGRIVLTPENLAAQGITGDTPLWLWVSAWASQTRDPNFGTVNNSDPGRMMYDVYLHQYSTDPGEVEPNDTVENAFSIAARSDTSTVGSFSSGADVDMYRVFLHETKMYTFFTANSTVTGDIGVELFRQYESDATGTVSLSENLLTESYAGNAGGGNFQIGGYVPERSGAYVVKLTGPSAGDYEFGVIDKGQVWNGLIANEPDNEIADATTQDALEVGAGAAAKTAMIYPANDVDYYHFNVESGTDLTLTISNTSALADDFPVQMTLIDPSSNVVQTSVGGISATAAESGVYLVRVEAVAAGAVGFYRISGGEPFTEKEPNDAFASATAIALGGNIYEASLTSGDTDYYSFTLEAGKSYSIRSLDNQTGGALTVGLYDEPNGVTLLDESGWATNYTGDNFKVANIMPATTQTYYLSVSGGVGSYKLTSRVNEGFYELISKNEPDNSVADADANGAYQSFGADVEYVLYNAAHPRLFGDEDWFRIELAAGNTLTAETKPVGNDPDLWNKDTDTKLVLFASDGSTELTDDDDGGNEWYSRISYTASAAETVYLQVRTSRDAAGGDDRSMARGDYYLNVDVKSTESEPNDSFADADGNPLRGGFIDAEFADGDNVDIYALSLQADHIYHIRTIKPEGGYGADFSAALFKAGATSTNLLSETNTGYNTRYSGSNVKLNIIPDETGVYYLRLTGTETGAYQVGIKGRDISALKSDGEPNNSIAEADAIGSQVFDQPGETRLSLLFNGEYEWTSGDEVSTQFGDDLDYYRYDLLAGDTLIAYTSPADGPTWPRDYDGYMELYDASGTMVAEDDDGAFDWHSRIEYVAPADGPYYVLVRSQDFGSASDRDPARGEYRLTVQNGRRGSVSSETDEMPSEFALLQNYPNPFSKVTNIAYSIPTSTPVLLRVYNLVGQEVVTLVDDVQSAGDHTIRFDGSALASGVYFYQLKAGNVVTTQKMLVVK